MRIFISPFAANGGFVGFTVIAAIAGSFIYMLYRRSKIECQLKEMNTQVDHHAVRDPTGLHNRRSFIALMSTRVARVLKLSGVKAKPRQP